ncbi:DUF6292 family protein [Saccharopolyspora taberi]|uniref:DUF6292 domain-containing protein n=1 Tax=Saccharopolyspora taberi TaxID=60895 RepID=A0ABN3VAB6_9PSEU
MDARSHAAEGLRNYVREVSAGLGDDVDVVDLDLAPGPATAIILVRSVLPTLPALPVLLTWDEINGWALRVEIDGDGDTTAVAYLGGDILPEPGEVHRFLHEAVRGAHPGAVSPPLFRHADADDDLERRLTGFHARG